MMHRLLKQIFVDPELPFFQKNLDSAEAASKKKHWPFLQFWQTFKKKINLLNQVHYDYLVPGII